MRTKVDRNKVFEKYNGHCGYCGKELKIKEMQVDHIEPIWKFNIQQIIGDPNEQSNLMPTCRRCNHYKRADNLEQFRHKMMTLHERAASHYIGKVAIDYGIITIKPFNGVFYFEKIKL